jgi:phosphoglycolate phosphatase
MPDAHWLDISRGIYLLNGIKPLLKVEISPMSFLPGTTTIEIVNPEIHRGTFGYVLFDFDGTISLIRHGWREIMIPMMVDILADLKTDETESELANLVTGFVDELTGKQTIYQMIRLCEEIEHRRGTPAEALSYKQQFNDLLNTHIADRLEGLRSGARHPEDLMLPGTLDLLDNLSGRGLELYLASGTDHQYVQAEAELLGITPYFRGRIFGAQNNYIDFSKAQVIQNILHRHAIGGDQLLGFGDGYVEIENVKAVGGTAVGVASDEARREGVNLWKRDRLMEVGADLIVPEYREQDLMMAYLCGE